MQTYLVAWPILSSRFHKADLSESLYNGAEEYKRLLSDIEINVLKREMVRPVKPFWKARPSDLFIKISVAIKNWGWASEAVGLTPAASLFYKLI